MTLSMGLSLLAFYFVLDFMPLEQLGMTPNFDLPVVGSALLLFLPFILLAVSGFIHPKRKLATNG